MQNYPQAPHDTERSTTAHHMADAVGYLMRVAAEAGLQTIVIKLANVRANLLNLATPPDATDVGGGEAGADESDLHREAHERRKPH
jgi:DhnA family fructose-bisphosphate aldolase class Ia